MFHLIVTLILFAPVLGNLEPDVGVQKPLAIVVLGDSLTDGYGLMKELAYPSIVEQKLKAAGRNVSVINAGISGSTSASAEGRLRWLLKSNAQILFLALGANDGLRGVALTSTEENLKKTIHLAKSSGMRVWLGGMKLPPNYGAKYVADFEQMYKRLAHEEKLPLLPFLLEGVAGVPTLNQPDGIHPNEAGQKIVAETVYRFFLEHL